MLELQLLGLLESPGGEVRRKTRQKLAADRTGVRRLRR
jgi:hypothetical protein